MKYGITPGALLLVDEKLTRCLNMNMISCVIRDKRDVRIYTGDGGENDCRLSIEAEDEDQATAFADAIIAVMAEFPIITLRELELRKDGERDGASQDDNRGQQ